MSDPGPSCDHTTGCITCGDVAEPLRVAEVDAATGLALCTASGGATTRVEIALVEPVVPGDVLLVHAGTAIAHAGGVSA